MSTAKTTAISFPPEGLIKELEGYCRPSSGREKTEEELKNIIHHWGWSWSPTKKLEPANLLFFHWLLLSDQLTEGILNTVLHFFPEAARLTSASKKTNLHIILRNKAVTLDLVKILVNAWPECIFCKDDDDLTALHCLCANPHLNASDKMEILEFLLQKNKGMVEISTREKGFLPIHFAAIHHSTPVPFMQKLIEAYPESVMKYAGGGRKGTPLHIACFYYNFPIVHMLVKANPDCLNAFAGPRTGYPINAAITGAYKTGELNDRAVPVLDFLVNFPGSKVASQEFRGHLPLHLACLAAEKTRRLQSPDLRLVKVLFNAFPRGVTHSGLTRDMRRQRRFCFTLRSFLHCNQVFALPYKKLEEEYGPELLHMVMRDELSSIGAIKLLVEGNPAALQTPNKDGAVPLHLAIQSRRPSNVIKILINHDSDRNTIRIADSKGNTALHYACLDANHEIIALILENYGPLSVSKRNLEGKLPLQLLFETASVGDGDKETTKYTESIFRLLRAFPEMGIY